MDTSVLLATGAATRAREELRFDYLRTHAEPDTEPGEPASPGRRVQPDHLLAHAGRWYLIAWEPARQD